MKVKYMQNYQNECGLSSILNLLSLYKINLKNIDLLYDKKGTSLIEMKKTLCNYFTEVNVIKVPIEEILNVKNFVPIIALIKNKEVSHYVVIYKKTSKYIYILDSLYAHSYKVKINEFKMYFSDIVIIPENIKIKNYKSKYKKLIFLPLISFLESIMLLSTTIILKQLIDRELSDIMLYVFIQMLLMCLMSIKIKTYLKTFKDLDKDIVSNNLYNIFHLKKDYLKKRDYNEIYYCFFESYQLKEMYLSLWFNLLFDIILAICIFILMFSYHFYVSLILLFILIPVIIISLFLFNKTKNLVENRRKYEYDFLSFYKDSLNENDCEKNYKICLEKLQLFQKEDYKVEKITHQKNQIFSYFQTVLISLIVIFYAFDVFSFFTIGSLVAFINMISLLLQPILNICSTIILFANKKLIINRLKDLKENIN